MLQAAAIKFPVDFPVTREHTSRAPVSATPTPKGPPLIDEPWIGPLKGVDLVAPTLDVEPDAETGREIEQIFPSLDGSIASSRVPASKLCR